MELRKRKHLPTTPDEQPAPAVDENVCSICDATFSRSGTLAAHVRQMHDNKCSICDATFSRSDTLAAHVRAMHGRESIVCGRCSKTFSSHQKLRRHVETTHSKDTLYQCRICEKTYPRRDSLTYHQRHTHWETFGEEGDDIFIARQCTKCLDKGLIHHHVIWAMKHGRPFLDHQCLICLRSTSLCSRLGRHGHNLDEVPRSKAHQCSNCYRLFGQQKTLNRHRCDKVADNTKLPYNVVSYL